MRHSLALLCLLAQPALAQEATDSPGAIIRALDKVSGLTQDIEVHNGESAFFGRIEITLGDCRYPTDDPTSDAFAHLKVFDTTAQLTAFDGWMVASSPALSALDHPRYDVWLLRCLIPATSSDG
ncbi:DUF2155 domain-containing protein [Albidovulum sediminicola]|uniref:DUF2155 domain-containing protein n=1 Tax=Albidovulum sediminicola TaxID=2984331 RepID=A0ABT2Z194_9RHOB|nr:DUF2155 domain-containing protein [Defluviimonas sp. WL0075]MCV2864913.1 DUF2155 domain-containing protein [Defluviimonas sp. WL0075]